MKVKTHSLDEEAAALLSSKSPPDPVLNRHCGECEFHQTNQTTLFASTMI